MIDLIAIESKSSATIQQLRELTTLHRGIHAAQMNLWESRSMDTEDVDLLKKCLLWERITRDCGEERVRIKADINEQYRVHILETAGRHQCNPDHLNESIAYPHAECVDRIVIENVKQSFFEPDSEMAHSSQKWQLAVIHYMDHRDIRLLETGCYHTLDEQRTYR